MWLPCIRKLLLHLLWLGAKGTVNALPQTGVRLRGGIPRLLRVIDRSLIVDRSAVYRTSALVPQSGAYELVIGTPLQGLASCIPFEVTGTTTRQKKAEVALLPADPAISIYAGKKSVIDFQLWDENQPIQILAPLRVRFSSLAFGWRATANGHVSEKGIHNRNNTAFARSICCRSARSAKELCLAGLAAD